MFGRKQEEVPKTRVTCPSCNSHYSALVREVESLIVETAEATRAGSLRVCIECGCMFVSVPGRVFRYHAQPKLQGATIPNGPAESVRPKLVSALGGVEP